MKSAVSTHPKALRTTAHLIAIASFCLSLMSAGCASNSKLQWSTTKISTSPPLEHVQNERNKPLTPEIIQQVLLGEVAAQRNDSTTAFTSYIRAAETNIEPLLAERATQLALKTGKPNLIRHATELWLKRSPNLTTPHRILALLEIQDKNLSAATTQLKEIIRIAEAANSDSYLQIAGTLVKTNNPTLSLKLMQQLTASAEEEPNAQLALGITANHAQRYDLANKALNNALLLKPNWPQALILLSKNAVAQNDPAKAQRILKDALDKNPDNSMLRYSYAQVLMENNHLTDAYNQFMTLNNKQPSHPNIIFTLGILAKQLDKSENARNHFKQLIRLKQRINDARYHLGELEEHLGNNLPAMEWYSQITGEQETRAKVRIAVLLSREGEIDQARKVLNDLRTATPELAAEIFLAEGGLLMDTGDIDTSLSVFNKAIEHFPLNTSLLYSRSILHSTLGQIDLMESDLQKALEIDPNHADALNALGYALADKTERYTEALKYIERALQIKPNHPAILDSMGWVLYRLGKNEEALKYLRRAMKLQPDPEIAAHLGEVLWTTGKTTQARQVWNKALDNDPSSDYLNDIIRRHP
jgi:tetratricopeptide (TPR) repeat protein